MAKILKSDASVGDAYAEIDLGSDQDEVWVTFSIKIPAAALALWAADVSGNFAETWDTGHGGIIDTFQVISNQWNSAAGLLDVGPFPAADTWTLVELHRAADGTVDLYIDSALEATNPAYDATLIRFVTIGQDLTNAGATADPDSIVYFDDVKVGTTRLGTDLFADDFEDGTLDAWTTLTGSVSVIDDAVTTPEGRVLIAFDDPALEADPAWTRIDDTPNLVAGVDIRRGRQTEFDVTETSTATVLLNDTAGLFDPNNTGSPYFGKLDGKQILLQLWNPVALEWSSLWRGHIDDYGHDFHPAVNADGEPLIANVAIQCVGLFAYLGNVEMIPGLFGDTPPVGSEGVVFYEDTDFQTRLTQLATDAGLPADRFRFFTGNVDVQETKYDPGDSILVAMRDTVDAEFPGIANLFEDRFGRVVAHGRKARFDPEATAVGSDWIFTRWKAGDGAAIVLDSDRAQIRPPLSWSRPRSRIYNAATAWPRFPIRGTGGGTFTETDMAGQIVVDSTSKDAFGYRSYPAMSDLITLAGTTTGNDAKDETRLFAEYYVANYKDPRSRVEALTFKSINPDDPRAEVTWALLAGFDISDVVNLKHGYPGGAGLDEDFFIEGSEMSIRPLNPDFDMVELTLNVSPAAYFLDDVFTP